MAHPTFHYRWQWKLQSSPQALWPWVSDTNRFNRDTGLPNIEELPSQLGVQYHRLRFKMMGMTVEWEEEPFEWVQPLRFGILRRYTSGPFAEMRVLTDLTGQPGGGTLLDYKVWIQPASFLGRLAIPLQIGVISARQFGKVFMDYDRRVAQGQGQFSPSALARLAPGGAGRLESQRAWLVEHGARPELVEKLASLVEQGDAITLAQMRPYMLADYWNAPRREVLETFLLATRGGLLELRWQLLCPVCRTSKQSADTLGGVRSQIHCETCNIDYEVNFDRSVEVVFRPNPAIRLAAESVQFCVGGPHSRPHVVAQQYLAPGEQRTLAASFTPGRYRARAQAVRGGQFLQAAPQGVESAALEIPLEAWPDTEIQVGLQPGLELINTAQEPRLLILEHFEWGDQAVTAADVTTLQAFRDLFSNEALRPNEQISVGNLTLVFTDLRDSTLLYRQIGDAPAFGRVMDHFAILKTAIAAEGGAIVKTMGDAVMAVFQHPAAALRAIFTAQSRLDSIRPRDPELLLKVGIHHGPCIAVTLNERLDYFGSVVNIASRLANLAVGGDVIISQAVSSDPEARQWLEQQGSQISAEDFQASIKGFDETFDLQRLRLTAK